MKPKLKAPGTKLSKLNYDQPVSNVPFKFKWRRYTMMVGNATAVDRASHWWAHRYTHNLAQLKYGYALKDIRRAQDQWEAKAEVGRCRSTL